MASMAGRFIGVSAQPGEHCFVTSTLSWRNRTTGTSGSWSAVVSGSIPPFSGTTPSAYLENWGGAGRVLVGNRPAPRREHGHVRRLLSYCDRFRRLAHEAAHRDQYERQHAGNEEHRPYAVGDRFR